MKIKTSVVVGLTIILLTLFSIFLVPRLQAENNENFVQAEIPVIIKPLDTNLINVQCERAFSSNARTLNTFSCNIVNKANVAIRAIGANYSLIADVNGVERRDSFSKVADAFIHPDLSKEVLPGNSLNISPSGPMSISNGVIKRLELEVNYIEFADGRSVGVSRKAIEKIASIRLGASMFKAWIKSEYLNRRRSEEALMPLLENNSEVGPVGNKNFANKVGEQSYRNFLREKYRINGRGAIKAVLDQ